MIAVKWALVAALLLASLANGHAEDRSVLLRLLGGDGHSQQDRAYTWHNHERSRFVEKPPHTTLPPRRLDQTNEAERYYMTPRGVCGDGGAFGPKFQTGNC